MLLRGARLLGVMSGQGFAIPAFNISSHSMLNAMIQVCEEKQSPRIMAIHPDELKYVGGNFIPSVIQAAYRPSVPTMIHLDRRANYEQTVHAIQCGFTSVMIDESLLPYKENIALTKKVVEAACPVGVQIEAELGTIGKTDDFAESGTDDIIYTGPQIVGDLSQAIEAGSPAIATGTCHGLCPSNLQPELKIDLSHETKGAVDVPSVSYGDSDNPDSEIIKTVVKGIDKIDISSDIKLVYFAEIREVLKDRGLRKSNVVKSPCEAALEKCASQKIDLFSSAGKADLY